MDSLSFTLSSPHHIWRRPDLVYYMLAFLPRGSLPSVARCANLFYHPAMSYAWRTIGYKALESLFELVFHEDDFERGWRTFNLYRSFVQDIRIPPRKDGVERTLITSIHYLSLLRPDITIPFPNLRILSLNGLDMDDFPLISWVLTPSLRILDIGYLGIADEPPAWDLLCETVFTAISKRAPGLVEIRFRDKTAPISLYKAVLDVAPRLPNLTTFSTTTSMLTNDMLEMLYNLPWLNDIFFIQTNPLLQPLIRTPAPHGQKPRFPRLTQMGLAATLPVALAFLPEVEGCELQRFFYKSCNDQPALIQVIQLSLVISSYSDTLLDLTICFMGKMDLARAPTFAFSDLSPILTCRRLKKFILGLIGTSLYLRDDNVRDMAKAWPFLEDIRVDWVDDDTDLFNLPDPPADTLGLVGLQALADGCPYLTYMEFSMVSTDYHPEPRLRAVSNSTPPVLLICQNSCHCEDSARIAVFLDALWPNLRIQGELDDEYDSWAIVSRHLAAIRGARVLRTRAES